MTATLERADVAAAQREKLRRMLDSVLPNNEFYRTKFSSAALPGVASVDDLIQIPFTTKSELIEDQFRHPPFGTDLTFPLARYIRIHQTSGTTGKPLYWLDTEESWNWWAECWKLIFAAAGVAPGDRVYFAFSFGPFIGFWTGWEGARKLGAMAVPGGGQSTAQRLRSILDCGATVLVCTPTYALHMAAEARKAGLNLASDSAIRITIHAGEPGASIPSTKKMIEDSWGAKCYDHAGATEVGAFAFECRSQPGGIHVNEDEFIAEVIDPSSGNPAGVAERGELVVTNLGRIGSPVIRYKTGDLVQGRTERCDCGSPFMLLQGGVLGRVDDMMIIRGVNVFPSAIENIMREFPEVEEFRVEVANRQAMGELKLIIEPNAEQRHITGLPEKIATVMRERIGLRPEVELVEHGSLPRFELKAKRFFKL
jgi:phenylacetate-CoA ligase